MLSDKYSNCANIYVSSELEHEYQLQQHLHFQTSGTQRHENTDFLQKTNRKIIPVSSWQIYYCFCKSSSPNIYLIVCFRNVDPIML